MCGTSQSNSAITSISTAVTRNQPNRNWLQRRHRLLRSLPSSSTIGDFFTRHSISVFLSKRQLDKHALPRFYFSSGGRFCQFASKLSASFTWPTAQSATSNQTSNSSPPPSFADLEAKWHFCLCFCVVELFVSYRFTVWQWFPNVITSSFIHRWANLKEITAI